MVDWMEKCVSVEGDGAGADGWIDGWIDKCVSVEADGVGAGGWIVGWMYWWMKKCGLFNCKTL